MAPYEHSAWKEKGGDMQFKDKVVLLTGASSGVGYEAALLFAAEGAKVYAVARRAERLHGLV